MSPFFFDYSTKFGYSKRSKVRFKITNPISKDLSSANKELNNKLTMIDIMFNLLILLLRLFY